MRQQLISWLIDDIVPEVKRSKDASGTILKFARDHNLATAQVEALGQLYNTAKTLSYLEKSASRGKSFPILDVEQMVRDFLEVKSASMVAAKDCAYEYDDQDTQGAMDLPACFAGLTHNIYREEKPAPAVVFDNPIKRASAEKSIAQVNQELVQQAKFEFQENFREKCAAFVQRLREEPDYAFDEVEADARGLYGDYSIIPLFNKLANFCQSGGWPVKRASVASTDKLVMDPHQVMPLVEELREILVQIKVAEEMLDSAGGTLAATGPVATNAPIVDKKKLEDIALKSAHHAGVLDEEALGLHPEQDAADVPEPEPIPSQAGGFNPWGRPYSNSSGKSDKTKINPVDIEDRKKQQGGGGKGGGGGGSGKAQGSGGGSSDSAPNKPSTYFDKADNWLQGIGTGIYKTVEPGAIKALTGGRNNEQAHLDRSLQDTQHLAMLQRLLSTDEILAEADPEQVVGIYNTIREMTPQLAGNADVMRVLLRSAVQHEGISPFDLKGILETESAKQKVDMGQQRIDDNRYAGAPLPQSKD